MEYNGNKIIHVMIDLSEIAEKCHTIIITGRLIRLCQHMVSAAHPAFKR